MSVGAVNTGADPAPVVLLPGADADEGVPVLNGASEQPESASSAARESKRSTGRSLTPPRAQGNPGPAAATSGMSAPGTPSSAGGSLVSGGHSGFGSSSVPTLNGRLTAAPSQYGEVSRPLK